MSGFAKTSPGHTRHRSDLKIFRDVKLEYLNLSDWSKLCIAIYLSWNSVTVLLCWVQPRQQTITRLLFRSSRIIEAMRGTPQPPHLLQNTICSNLANSTIMSCYSSFIKATSNYQSTQVHILHPEKCSTENPQTKDESQ